MRRPPIGIALVAALAALAVGMALTACGRAGGAQPAAAAPRTQATAPGTLATATAPGAAAAGKTMRSRSWTFRGLRDHGREVSLRYTEGDCWGAGHAHVTQTKSSVTIELLQPYSGGAGVACPLFVLLRNLQVELAAPLGHRRLIHAPLGAARG